MDALDFLSADARAAIEALVEEAVERKLAERDALAPDGSGATPSPFMTVAEAAAYLRRPEQYVRDLLSARRLATVKVGGEGRGYPTLVRRDEIEALVTARC